MPSDMDDMLQDDVEKVRDGVQTMRGGDGFDPDWATVGEFALWGLALALAMGFVAVMPWVGPDGVLTGTQWLGGGIGGVVAASCAAYAVRLARSELDTGRKTYSSRARGKR